MRSRRVTESMVFIPSRTRSASRDVRGALGVWRERRIRDIIRAERVSFRVSADFSCSFALEVRICVYIISMCRDGDDIV